MIRTILPSFKACEALQKNYLLFIVSGPVATGCWQAETRHKENKLYEGALVLLSPRRGTEPPPLYSTTVSLKERTLIAVAMLATNPSLQNDLANPITPIPGALPAPVPPEVGAPPGPVLPLLVDAAVARVVAAAGRAPGIAKAPATAGRGGQGGCGGSGAIGRGGEGGCGGCGGTAGRGGVGGCGGCDDGAGRGGKGGRDGARDRVGARGDTTAFNLQRQCLAQAAAGEEEPIHVEEADAKSLCRGCIIDQGDALWALTGTISNVNGSAS